MARTHTSLLVLALCLGAASVAQAQSGNVEELLSRCVITPEIANMTDYQPIIEACSLPLDQRCEACPCSLVGALTDTLQDLGYEIDLSTLTQDQVTVAFSLCQDVLLEAIILAGVDLNGILELASCTTQSTCVRLGAGA